MQNYTFFHEKMRNIEKWLITNDDDVSQKPDNTTCFITALSLIRTEHVFELKQKLIYYSFFFFTPQQFSHKGVFSNLLNNI